MTHNEACEIVEHSVRTMLATDGGERKMKATELIAALKSEIETYGDLELRNIDGIPFLYVEQCSGMVRGGVKC